MPSPMFSRAKFHKSKHEKRQLFSDLVVYNYGLILVIYKQ